VAAFVIAAHNWLAALSENSNLALGSMHTNVSKNTVLTSDGSRCFEGDMQQFWIKDMEYL